MSRHQRINKTRQIITRKITPGQVYIDKQVFAEAILAPQRERFTRPDQHVRSKRGITNARVPHMMLRRLSIPSGKRFKASNITGRQ
ncbi:hypothetical protein GCM10011503_06160 [Henriciella pelagia]|uniref:Uncharacterized protein n=1 Tax=Henriciella pelagia TaxID=1977912 RepID=A0ABQ1J5B2_9PROT|nr:hypothetical protein GCM10011503_06160 [Henriciella pelagia]